MRIIFIIMSLCVLIVACAGTQYPKSEIRLEKGGEAYCEAFRAKDDSLKSNLAKRYRLHARDWERYCANMQLKNYSSAYSIAEEKNLGKFALKKAGMHVIWRDLEEGSIFFAYATSKELGLTTVERRALGTTAFYLKLQNAKCFDALSIVKFFDLSVQKMDLALQCVAKNFGSLSALSTGCTKQVSKLLLVKYKKIFLEDLPRLYGQYFYQDDFDKVIRRCEWSVFELQRLLAFFRFAKDYQRSFLVLQRLADKMSKKEVSMIARSLFDESLASKDTSSALKVFVDYPEVIRKPRKIILLALLLETRQCAKALLFTYTGKLSDADINMVFTAPRCAMSSFDRFEREFSGASGAMWEKYFHLALKYQRFDLASRLAGISEIFCKKGIDHHDQLINDAFRVKAHALLLVIKPPSDEDVETYKNRIFEDALANGEEWVAATYAREHHPNPESIIERSYLRAAERGEFILATQIAKSYGSKSKVVPRGILAFEMAMIAKKPAEAQFILRLIGLKDSARMNRAVTLRFRIRREKQRKAWREKRKRERKKKHESGEWSVTHH